MLKRILGICLVVLGLLTTACESSEVTMVKEATLEYDKSKTWEQVFTNYQYISKGEWSTFTTDKGKEIIRYTANYDVKGFFDEINAKKPLLSNELIEKAKQDIEKQLPVKLIVDFMLSDDKKQFFFTYVGFEVNGKTVSRHEKLIEQDLIHIVHNKPLGYLGLAEKNQQIVIYGLLKAIFAIDNLKDLQFATATDLAVTNNFTVPNLAQYEDTRSPMIIYTVKDIEYYDQKQDIYLKLDYEVTDKPDPEMDTVYLGREQVVENLGNAKILYKNAMRVPLTAINSKEFYNTLITDSYINIYFSDEKAGAIGIFIGMDNQKTELSPHSATPAIEFQEYLDKFFIKKSANAPAPNTTREEIYINGLQEKNGVINVSYCISETDICDTVYAKKGTEAYNFIKSNNVLYKKFFCDIDTNGMIVKIISPTPSNASNISNIVGTYKYQEEGFSGGMKISLANNGVQIDLDTASEYTGNTCGVEALLCRVEGKTILCPSEEQGFDPIIITIIDNKTVEIIQGSNTYYCGMNGNFLGKYIR